MNIDYAAEAVRLVEVAFEAQSETSTSNLLAAAQAEATLALVEQQRIANLIALAGVGPQWEQDALHENVQTDPDATFPIWKLRDDIREGLGLND